MLNSRIISSRFSTRPLYLQVRDALAERVAAGEWKPSTAIPNEGDLARHFGVSPGTMRTFVNDQSSDELAVRYSNLRGQDGDHVGGEVQLLDLSEAAVSEAECMRLRLRMHEKVHRIRRVRLSGGRPYMFEEVAMPASLFPGLSECKEPSHRIVVLAQQFGVLLGKGEERIAIGSSSPEVARTLRMEPGATVLLLDRLVYTLDGRPAEWRLGQCDMAGKHYLAEIK